MRRALGNGERLGLTIQPRRLSTDMQLAFNSPQRSPSRKRATCSMSALRRSLKLTHPPACDRHRHEKCWETYCAPCQRICVRWPGPTQDRNNGYKARTGIAIGKLVAAVGEAPCSTSARATSTPLSLRRWAAEPAHPCPRLRAVLVRIYAGLGAARLWSSRLLHFARAKPPTQIPSENRGGSMITDDPRVGQFR